MIRLAQIKCNPGETMTGKKLFLSLLFLLLNMINCPAQNNKTYNMEQLKSKKKHELVELALEILKEKQPSVTIDPDEFEVTVFGNSQDILVEWKKKVTFIPLEIRFKGVYQYDIMVSVMTNCISKTHHSDIKSNNFLEQDSLFTLTKDDEKIIEIANQAYNECNEKGQMYVVEKENDYEMIYITNSFRSSQLIEKETFSKGLLTHKEKILQSKPQNYLEIK